MSFRIEEKLFINQNQLVDFKDFLKKKNATQIYNPRIIESLYFENLKKEMYEDSIEGLVPRKKIRVRIYPEEKEKKIFLETKVSSVEGRHKTRREINEEQFNKIKEDGIFDFKYGTCKPLLYVSYKREYFKIKDVRI